MEECLAFGGNFDSNTTTVRQENHLFFGVAWDVKKWAVVYTSVKAASIPSQKLATLEDLKLHVFATILGEEEFSFLRNRLRNNSRHMLG